MVEQDGQQLSAELSAAAADSFFLSLHDSFVFLYILQTARLIH
jgi:hypothetical protein